MIPNPKETPQHEPVSLHLEGNQLTPTGEWANYLLNLGKEYAFRRDVPKLINPDHVYALKWVPQSELRQYLGINDQDNSTEETISFWKIRLSNLEKELEKTDSNNSRLGISLLILKGFIEDQQRTQDGGTLIDLSSSMGIEGMVGNGLRVISKTDKKVRLTPTVSKNEQVLVNRGIALDRLGTCFQDMDMLRIPKPLYVSASQKIIEVECAPGLPLSSIDSREKQQLIDEMPPYMKHRLVVQLLRGIDNLNMQGYVYGDYNASSFSFDPVEKKLWITDPGLNEIVNGEYSTKLPIEKASSAEVYKMFETSGFLGLLETFGVKKDKISLLKQMSSQNKFKDISEVIDVLES